ncbi:hypothetical protein PV326_009901, partial [Microctonus aethiopoides]
MGEPDGEYLLSVPAVSTGRYLLMTTPSRGLIDDTYKPSSASAYSMCIAAQGNNYILPRIKPNEKEQDEEVNEDEEGEEEEEEEEEACSDLSSHLAATVSRSPHTTLAYLRACRPQAQPKE